LFLTIAIIGIICALLGRILGAVRKLMENTAWQGAGRWFRKGAGTLVGLLVPYS